MYAMNQFILTRHKDVNAGRPPSQETMFLPSKHPLGGRKHGFLPKNSCFRLRNVVNSFPPGVLEIETVFLASKETFWGWKQ